ncbi:MAG: hypothetical protein NXI31_13610 [bacterium]|nr:hypothetical protein [bacterium]
MFSTKEFQAWGKDQVLFAAVMTKIEGRKDDALLRTYGFGGFPSLAVIDAAGDAISTKVPRDLNGMKNYVGNAGKFAALTAKKNAGEEYDQKAYLMAALALEEMNSADAYAEIKRLGLKGDELKAAEQAAFVIEMNEIAKSARGRNVTKEDRMKACLAVYEAFKAGGRVPEGAAPEAFVDAMLIEAGTDKGDADAFFYSYDRERKRRLERIKMLEGYIPRFEGDIEKYKDNEQRRKRAESTLERVKSMIESAREAVEELDATAKKLKG